MYNILNWFLKPFKNDFSYLFLFFLLISSIDVYHLISNQLVPYAIYIGFHGYITAYFLTLIGQNLPIKGYSFYKKILLSIAFISFIMDSFCLLMYGISFSQDFATIIMQTFIAEVKEFIDSYVSIKYLFII